MNCCYRYILNLIVVVIFIYFPSTPAAGYSLSISVSPVSIDNFFLLGVEKMRNGKYQEAIQDFQQAIAKNKNFVAAYSNRCLAEVEIQDYQSAIADCTRAINLAPRTSSEAYLNRGLAYYRQGNYPAAIADYNQAIALKPYNFRAYYNRGIANASIGNYQQAIADYNLALSQIPSGFNFLVADIYNDRGLARLQLQNPQAAMLDFDKAIRLHPLDERAFFNRGCACALQENYTGAVRDFTEATRLAPGDGDAYINRGIALYHLGYEQRAIADLQKAAALFDHQGKKIAYKKTLSLIKFVQQQMSSHINIALVKTKYDSLSFDSSFY